MKAIADWLLARVEYRPKVGIVCGSGLGGLGDRVENPVVIPYSTIPDFPSSTGKQKVLIEDKLCQKIYNGY